MKEHAQPQALLPFAALQPEHRRVLARPPNKGLHPTVRGASLRSAPRPAAEAQVVRPIYVRAPAEARHTAAARACLACRRQPRTVGCPR